MSDVPMSSNTFKDIIEAGEIGDSEVEVKLTARQVASLQFILGLACDEGLGIVAVHALERHYAGLGALLNLEFDRAQARLAFAMGRALDEPSVSLAAVRRLAELDQQAAEIEQ